MASEVLTVANSGGVSVAASRSRNAVLEAPSVRLPRRPLSVIGDLFLNLPIFVWVVLDTAIVATAVLLGYEWFSSDALANHVESWTAITLLASSLMVCSLIFGLHEREALVSKWHILIRMLLTAGTSAIITYAIIYALMYTRFSRRVAALALVSYFVIGLSIRLFTCYAVCRIKRRLLTVGSARACEAFVSRLDEGILAANTVVGWVRGTKPDRRRRVGNLKELGTTDDVVRICCEMNVSDIVVCNGIATSPEVMTWMLPCLRLGCRVTNEATFFEKLTGRIPVDEITPEWFLFSDLKTHCDKYASVKRVLDVVVAIIGLIISLPLYPLLALAIKLEDGGPVFYSQNRVGRNGAIFKLHKFRTMRINAENGRVLWASRNDPRATRVGRVLRKTRMDELPQLFDILRGQMSLIGPRPERPEIVEQLCRHIPFWSERDLVKPGLTGWAQISYHYGNTIADAKRKLQFDLYYIKNMGLELDLVILFRTVGTFLRGAC